MWFDVFVFILVLGELVFFHEMGHFLAAKACGIYCERFSLGMPPRVFGFKFGETDYCIGLLPIGGYVKMAGQEDVPLSEDERKEQYGSIPPDRWYMNKPVWQRMIVIGAGPFMNVVLAVLLYAIVAAYGAEVPESKVDTRIGLVEDSSPASQASLYRIEQIDERVDTNREPDGFGWKTGDRILRVRGKEIRNIMDLAIDAVLSAGGAIPVVLERTSPDGDTTLYYSEVLPEQLETDERVRFGMMPFQTALVGNLLEDMPAQAAGIRPGDVITKAQGQIIDAQSFSHMVSKLTSAEPVTLEVQREDQTLELTLAPKRIGRFKGIEFTPPLDWLSKTDPSAPLSVSFEDEALLARTGLRLGDRVKRVDNKPGTGATLKELGGREPEEKVEVVVERSAWPFGLGGTREITCSGVAIGDFIQAVTRFDVTPRVLGITEALSKDTGLQAQDIVEEVDGKPATTALLREIQDTRIGETVRVKVRKPEIGYGLMRKESSAQATITVEPVGIVGIVWQQRLVVHRVPPAKVLPEAMYQTRLALDRTMKTLGLLVTGKLSVQDLGGPVMIFSATTAAARRGYSWLLEITAFISINLAIFNMLPLPVLDGGHMVFLTIEGVRRKPVNARITEWVQQAGLVLIIGLMLFVTFNDIRRLFTSFLP